MYLRVMIYSILAVSTSKVIYFDSAIISTLPIKNLDEFGLDYGDDLNFRKFIFFTHTNYKSPNMAPSYVMNSQGNPFTVMSSLNRSSDPFLTPLNEGCISSG